MYQGVRYEFSQAPNETDLNYTFVKLIATRQKLEEVSKLTPINPTPETITINYKNRVEANNGGLTSEECTTEYADKLTD